MKQKIFATQQMAMELQKEAIAIWRQGNHEEYLEGMEKDPVVSLLMTALAYQDFAADHELERLKTEVMDDFSHMLIPYELCHAVPASVLLQTSLEDKISKLNLGADQVFTLAENKYNFIPLLNTTVYNATVRSVVRMDARRWKVSLSFKEPVSDLGGLSFLVDNTLFKDLNISIGGRPLSLIKPWDYAELPLSDCFSIDSMLYNQSLAFDASATWFDMFAQHNKRLFVVDRFQTTGLKLRETDSLDLVFEFMGIQEEFVFDKSQLLLNCVLLVNATLRGVTLSSASPIARIAGNEGNQTENLLHLLRPSSEQLYKDVEFTLRRSATERFNVNGLLKLLHCLLDKYATDYYAFMQVDRLKNGMEVSRLYQWLKNLTQYIEEVPHSLNSDAYLMMKKGKNEMGEMLSLTINYLTTSGSRVNAILSMNSSFNVPVGLSVTGTRVIAEPVSGVDEVRGADVMNSLSKYYMVTNNRLVTPADVKIFCYNELLKRYNLDSSLVSRISVKNHLRSERGHSGFETVVEIILENDLFVKKSFASKLSQAELVLQKMIEVRSATPYPVQVSIRIV